MTTATPYSIAYTTENGTAYYNLNAAQTARMEMMKQQAAIDFACGKPVVEVYVSTLVLQEPEFMVPTADFAELRKMVDGHLQLAQICELGLPNVPWRPSMGF